MADTVGSSGGVNCYNSSSSSVQAGVQAGAFHGNESVSDVNLNVTV